MIQIIKDKIWDLLKEKDVSLAFLFDDEGKILWSKGRRIAGKTIGEGEGFTRTYIEQALKSHKPVRANVDSGLLEIGSMTDSVMLWNIKSLFILPLGNSFFLYIDSGTREAFTSRDYERFETLGGLLGDTINQVRKNETDRGGISGSSEAIQQIRDLVVKYAIVDEPILLKGETGTGKSHIAELIHFYSGRPGKFKVIHTPGIPHSLFENEMFGHTRGAFTDARNDRKGLINEAEGGTLFIDEITEVPVAIQAKLLRFVESKKYTVLGECRERAADVRIVAATNKDIGKAIEALEFREDLYYRLNVLEIDLPPLRLRKEDIKDLVMENRKYLQRKNMGKGFWEALHHHHWPGNIRELITVLKRAGVVDKETIDGEVIQKIIHRSHRSLSTPMPMSYNKNKTDNIWEQLNTGKTFWEAVKSPFLDRELNRDEVKEILQRGLRETNGVYKGLLEPFNLVKSDYKNFMRFLYDNRLK